MNSTDKKMAGEISFSPIALKSTGSLEQACILGFLAKKLSDPGCYVEFSDGEKSPSGIVKWVKLSKQAFVKECLVHLEGKDLKSVDRYLAKMEESNLIRKSWHDGNPARDAAYWTFGYKYFYIDDMAFDKFGTFSF